MKTVGKSKAEKTPTKLKTVKGSRRSRVTASNGKRPPATYEHAPIGLVEASLEGTYINVNEEFCRIVGYTKEELLGRSLKEISHEEDYPMDIKLHEQLVSGDIPFYRFEKRYLRKDGGEVWVELTRSIVRDEQGDPLYTIGVVLDISERKHVERVLRESVERLRLATEAAQMFTWEWDFVTNNYSLSDNFTSVLGFETNLLSKNRFETLDRFMPAEDLQAIIEAYQKAVETQRDLHSLQGRVINPENGQTVWLELSAKIIYDHEGKPERMYGVAQNVTENKKVQDEIAIISRVPSENPNPVMRLTPEGKVLYANGPALTILQAWKLQDQQTVPDHLQRHVAEVFASGLKKEIEIRQNENTFSCTLAPIREAGYINLYGNNITARKQAEETLSEFARQQSALYTLSDELHRTTSLEDVFNVSLDAILSALQCDRASVLLFDETDVMRFVAWRGLSEAYRQATDGHSPWKPATKDPKPISMDDIHTAEVDEALRAVIQQEGIGSLAFIPLVSNGKLIGKFMIYFNTPHKFGDDEMDLSLTIANQLAFGIERKRAEKALRVRARQQQAVARLGELAVRERDLQKLFDLATTMIAETLEIEYCKVLELLEGNESLKLRSGVGWREGLVGNATVDSGPNSQAGYTLQSYTPVVVVDLRAEQRFNGPPLLVEHGVVSGMSCIIRGADGQPWGVLGAHTTRRTLFTEDDVNFLTAVANILGDAIQQQKAEQALRQSEERYRAVVESQSEMLCRFQPDGKILFVNGAYARARSTTPEALMNSDFWDFIPEEDRPAVRAMLDTLTPATPEVQIENRFQTAEGERWTLWTNRALTFDANGKLLEAQSSGIDITERKQAEQALHESEEQFRTMANTMPSIVWTAAPDGTITYANDQWFRFVGITPEKNRSGWPELVLHPDDYERCVRAWTHALETVPDEYLIEVRNRRYDGQYRWFQTRATPVRDESGRAKAWYGVTTDIHERIEAEQRMALLAGISDMLRNVDDPSDLLYRISEAVGEHLHVKRALFNEIDLEHDREVVQRDYHSALDSVTGIHKVSDYSSITSAEMAAGRTVINTDSKTDPRTAQDYERTYAVSGERAYVAVPLMRDNRWVASFWVSDDVPRQWSSEEVSLLETVAERTWAIIEKLRINKALSASEQRFREIFETAGVSVWVEDFTEVKQTIEGLRARGVRDFRAYCEQNPDFVERAIRQVRILDVNNETLELFGARKKEDLLGSLSNVFTPETKPLFIDELVALAEGREMLRAETQLRTLQGRLISTLFTVHFAPSTGDQSHVVVTLTDISERKQIEEALRRNEKMFSTLVDAAPFGVYFIDSEFRLRAINKGSEAVFSGIDPLLGRDFAEILRIVWKEPFATETIERFRHTLRTGESFISPPIIEERANIEEIQAYDWQIHRITLSDGTFGVVCYFYDLSEQKRMEATVRASETLYRTIARNIPGGGVYVVDKDFRYLVAEGPVTEAFGLSREILEGHTVSEVFPDERGARMEDRLRRNFAGETVEYETKFNGHVYWTQQAPLHDSIGQAIILTIDITERKQAEEALRQSEERFAQFMQHLPGLSWIKDMQGRYVYANAAAEKAFSIPRERLYGKTDEEIFPSRVAAQFKENDQRALTEERGVQVIETLEHDDGILHYSLVSKFPIPGPDGKPALIGGTAFDITERRRAEEAFRVSEARYRNLFDLVPIAVYTCDAQGLIQEYNQRAAELWGREPRKNDPTEKYCGSFKIFYPDGRFMPHEACPMSRVLHGETLEASELEILVERPDGTRRNIMAHPFPLQNEHGEIVGAINCLYDITERRRAEEALRESEERFRAILRQATAGIVRKNAEGDLIFVNQAFCNMLGYTESDLLGKTVWDFMHPADVAENQRRYHRMMEEGIPFKLERRLLRRDGSIIWVDASVSPIMDARGRPQTAVAVEVDITGRKRAEEALRELNLQLEDRVLSRTAKLRAVNQTLREEIAERKRVEEALRRSESAARTNEEKLRTLFDLLPVGISFLDPKGQIVQMNSALLNILKLSKEELLGQGYKSRKYIRTDGMPMAPTEFASARALAEQKTVHNIETGILLENGEVVWTNISASPVDVADVGVVVVTVDITDSKRAERALQESHRRLRILSQRLVEVQEDERRALARELHDRVGQTLAALNINLIIINSQLTGEAAEQIGTRLNDSMKLVGETIALVRDVMTDLRPSVLDDYGLEAALESHLAQFISRYNIDARLEKPAQPFPRLGPSIEMTMLRIAQEALMNIARHARATQVNLSLRQEAAAVCLAIRDNGIGIESWQEANRPGSHGLTIMRERAEAFGGSLQVRSNPGQGTVVEVSIPHSGNGPLEPKEKKNA